MKLLNATVNRIYEAKAHTIDWKKEVSAIFAVLKKGKEISDYEVEDALFRKCTGYTGATVGGVTTGGFHVQKGGVAITSMKKNGKFYLSYELIPPNQYQNGSLAFIELTDSDFKEFQKTRLDHLITTEEKKKMYNLVGKNLIDASDLSENAANALKSWLTGQSI